MAQREDVAQDRGQIEESATRLMRDSQELELIDAKPTASHSDIQLAAG
jgi:hypothetical protein